MRNKVNNLNKRLKKDFYFEQFNDNIGDSRRTWKTLRSLSNKSKSSQCTGLRSDSGNLIKDIDIANAFNEYFVPDNDTNCVENDNVDPITDSVFHFRNLTEDFVCKELSNLSSRKSCGLDNIPPHLLKLAAPFITKPLTHLFNSSISTSIIPLDWKRARVTPVYKSGQKDQVCNYRPISVLCHVMKILEKGVHMQIYSYFTDNGLLSNCQSGFRPLYSTTTALIDVNDHLLKNIDQKYVTGALFLDFKRAFDSVNHSILINKLAKYGICHSELLWFKNYLMDRAQCVSFDGTLSNFRIIKTGIPQGSILGPLLFTIFINDICDLNFTEKTKLCLYADDAALFCKARDNASAQTFLQCEFNKIMKWVKDNDLQLNLNKCKVMLFGTRKKIHGKQIIVRFEDFIFQQVYQYKYLGITLDNLLRYDKHVEMVCGKIARAIGYIRQIKYYLPQNVLIMLYNGLLLPYIDYGLVIWGKCAQYLLSKVQKLQNRFARIILNVDYYTPNLTLRTQLKWQSIAERVHYQFCLYMFKIVNGLAPNYLKDLITFRTPSILTRYATTCPLYIPKPNTDYFKRSFQYHGSITWNNLPHSVRTSTSLISFKRKCKHLF